MFKFTKDFNCCKTVSCANFGLSNRNSDSYIQKSERLGYLSIECELCGSNPPWISNSLVKNLIAEKLELQFGQKVVGCKKCSPYYFMMATPDSKLHGFTSAGTQRKKCTHCGGIFTLPDFKNIDALKQVLNSVTEKKEVKAAIQESGLSARLYYFYLNKLSLIFSNFSRLNELQLLNREYLGIHSEGRLLSLNHQRALYHLFSVEIESGYVLLQSNNLTKLAISEAAVYQETTNTLAANIDSDNIETVLLARYQSNLKRNHFEQLLIGSVKPLGRSSAIYPDKVAYTHFQLLKAFTDNVQRHDHFIEHESTLRSAALMSSYAAIKNGSANVFYFLPFLSNAGKLNGQPLGWWNDIWFSNEIGAFSSITRKYKTTPSFKIKKGTAIESYHCYLNNNLNKNINSMQVVNDLSEIYRVLYNYCEDEGGATAASQLGLVQKCYQPEQLLALAIKQLSNK
ncbi:hypothetical protein GCM10007916_36130 [Psychromonas marina]|uniref:IS1 family transposase n=1 Tax=Psychromonas marina TaxID=88364 RepID=A0ABQ6E5C6_9GAMM|nr:hypothetical protein [Psychromonas marina]GLS92541.1 hypothetical protein GCM10007916_36130 [Psychromonas marina]